MLKDFENWLLSQNYTPNTAIDYASRITRLCQKEAITLEKLAKNIKSILPDYERNGKKSSYGRRSHSSVLNALRQFRNFLAIYM